MEKSNPFFRSKVVELTPELVRFEIKSTFRPSPNDVALVTKDFGYKGVPTKIERLETVDNKWRTTWLIRLS